MGCETRHRTRAARALPSLGSLAGPVGAACRGQDDAWLDLRNLVDVRSLGLVAEAFDRKRRAAWHGEGSLSGECPTSLFVTRFLGRAWLGDQVAYEGGWPPDGNLIC